MKYLSFALLLFICHTPLFAQVYKCTQPDGRVIYSDQVCPGQRVINNSPSTSKANPPPSSKAKQIMDDYEKRWDPTSKEIEALDERCAKGDEAVCAIRRKKIEEFVAASKKDTIQTMRAYQNEQNMSCERGDKRACQESECGAMANFDSPLWSERRPEEFRKCARLLGNVSGNFWTIPSSQSTVGQAIDAPLLRDGDEVQNPALLLCYRKRGGDQKVRGDYHHIIEYQKMHKQNGKSWMTFSYILSDRYLASGKKKTLHLNIHELAEDVCER